MGLSKKEKDVIHEALGAIAAERVRVSQEMSEHAIKSIKLRDIDRGLGRVHDVLAELLVDEPAKAPGGDDASYPTS